MTILEIFQRFCALVILGPLAWLAILTKTDIIKWESSMFTCMQKNKLYPSPLSWDMAKILQTCYFCNLSMPGHGHKKRRYQVVENVVFIFMQKIKFIPHLFWNIAKTLQTYLTYFGHAWPHPPKTLVSTCRKC